jgi:hypothetical protein
LNAVADPSTFSITVNPNGGRVGSYTTTATFYSPNFSGLNLSASRSGYNFTGFSTGSSGNNILLTANWVYTPSYPSQVTISIKGGSSTSDYSVSIGTTINGPSVDAQGRYWSITYETNGKVIAQKHGAQQSTHTYELYINGVYQSSVMSHKPPEMTLVGQAPLQ